MSKLRRLELSLQGRVPSKKNAKQIIYVRGKPLIISSKAWAKFEKDAVAQLKTQKIVKLKPPYRAEYAFYMKGKGATDLDNMIAGINDILEKVGVLENDKHIHSILADKVLGEPEYLTSVIIYEVVK